MKTRMEAVYLHEYVTPEDNEITIEDNKIKIEETDYPNLQQLLNTTNEHVTERSLIVSVQSLITEPFNTRSSTEKNEIKRIGRPTPYLIIQQSMYSTKRNYSRTFNSDFYYKHTWICGCLVKNALFCFPCLLFGGDVEWTKIGITELNHLGKRITGHSLTENHMKNAMQLSLFGTVNIPTLFNSTYRRNLQLHNENVRHNRYILNIIINCLRYCGAFDLALRAHDESTTINFSAELEVALKEHLVKAAGFKGTLNSLPNEILETMFSVCQEEISREIKEADYFSVIVDETSDVSNIYQMAIVFRYIAKGRPVERFWNLLTPSDQDTKTLSSIILAELEKHVKDDKTILIAQTYDGAAVLNGVQAIVKQTHKQAAYVHYAHQLNLVLLNAASANTKVRIFFANLEGICTFFSNSPQRIAILDETVKKSLLCAAPTRWDFKFRIVCTVFEHREDIVAAMQTILNESMNTSTNIINQASGYITILTSDNFIFWLNLFYKIMRYVYTLFQNFQSKDICSATAERYIISFEIHIGTIRDSITELQNTIDPLSIKRHKHNMEEQWQEAKEVCDIIISQGKDLFNFIGHLIAETLFFSENFDYYSARFPDHIFQDTIKAYPCFNGQKLRAELTAIYKTQEFRSVSGLLPFYDSICQNKELCETFSETLKLLNILITVPTASDEVERCFYTVKRIKTFLKNTVIHEKLSALTMISQERDLIESISDFNQRVIEKFASSKDRNIDFLFS